MILRKLRERLAIKTVKFLTPNIGESIEKIYYNPKIFDANQLPRPMIKFIAKLGLTQLVGAEVGVACGDNSLSIFETLNMKLLHEVDPYLGTDASPDTKAKAFQLLKNKATGWHIKTSIEAAKEIPEPLDFVYIDAAHDYTNVKSDIATWFTLVRKGGVIGGHDFCSGSHSGLIDAVVEFAKKEGYFLNIECPDWFVVK